MIDHHTLGAILLAIAVLGAIALAESYFRERDAEAKRKQHLAKFREPRN